MLKRKKDKSAAAVKPDISASDDNATEESKVAAYISGVRLRKTLLGIDERDMWTIASNIQKYYEKRADEDAAVIAALKEENERLAGENAKQKLYINAMGGPKK